MGELMQERRVVRLGRRAGGGADEGLARGKVHAVGRGAIEGPATAVGDRRSGRCDKRLGLLDRRDDGSGRVDRRWSLPSTSILAASSARQFPAGA